MTSQLDIIKSKINNLYVKKSVIHINVTLTNPRVNLKNQTAIIKNVYPHIFQIEECNGDNPKCYTLQYTDVLTKQIDILELNF